MTEIRLLALPCEVGAPRMGVGRGPELLIESGAEGRVPPIAMRLLQVVAEAIARQQ